MSKLDRLIAELCPDGVSFRALGDATMITRGVRVIKSQLSESGKYPVYQNSMTPLGYFDKSNYPANTTFIISAGAAGEIGYSTVDFWAADDCFCFVCPENLQSRFLYFALLCQQEFLFSRVRRASVPRLARTVVEQLKIPLPPLSISRSRARVNAARVKRRVTVTTIQKLDVFVSRNKTHDIYKKHIVIIFDECHRSQFGEMHQKIIKAFRNYHIFGFTGTPIYAFNYRNIDGVSVTLNPDCIHRYYRCVNTKKKKLCDKELIVLEDDVTEQVL